MRAADLFVPVEACWICGASSLTDVHELIFELSAYGDQDPALAAYTGQRLTLRRCVQCGFGQPAAVPALPRFFARMYDQRWASDWIAAEHETPVKDYIFGGLLASLAMRLPSARRRLLDVGAHAGRFVALAQRAGWDAEGVELNPRTAAYAASRSGRPIHQVDVRDWSPGQARFDALVLTDVLEHIPEPLAVLRGAASLLAPGGWIAVKVPHGPNQLRKEVWRGRLRAAYRPTVADNLVHVNHFSPRSLHRALRHAGFTRIDLTPGAPELPAGTGTRPALARAVRRAAHRAAVWCPGGIHTPIAFNLQAYARRD